MAARTRLRKEVEEPFIVLHPDDYTVLGEQDFGVPGLEAVEMIGPFAPVVASGPLITVHDARIEPHKGISHHPHRNNERIFYILAGELDHDDALNDIKGHLQAGDAGLFTEGQRGMLHSEWNNGDVPTHAFILVYPTEPVPAKTALAVLPRAEMPVYEEEGGARTREVVGRRSGLEVNGDVRLLTDSQLDKRDTLNVQLGPDEGGLVYVQDGKMSIDGQPLGRWDCVLFPPADAQRSFALRATAAARALRVVHGRGFGLQRQWRQPSAT